MISTLLNLVFNPLKGSLDTVQTLLHNSVTRRGSLSESSCEIDGREILPSLVLSSLRTCRGTFPIGAPEGLGEIQILAKSVLSS